MREPSEDEAQANLAHLSNDEDVSSPMASFVQPFEEKLVTILSIPVSLR
jgi:hypothetical protein